MKTHADFFAFRRYRLEFEGVSQGAFETFNPPGRRIEPAPDGARSRPVAARLERGVANTRALLEWFSPALGGEPLRRTVTVVEHDAAGQVVARHRLAGAWPTRVQLATLTTDVFFEVEAVDLEVAAWGWEPVEVSPES